MPTMYLTGGFGSNLIQAVEVDRFNDKSVWILDPCKQAPRRRDRNGGYYQYHETWQAAKDALLASAEADVNGARRQLELANAKLGNIKGLKDPNRSPTQ